MQLQAVQAAQVTVEDYGKLVNSMYFLLLIFMAHSACLPQVPCMQKLFTGEQHA